MQSAGQGRPAPVAAVSDNARAWAKFGRPEKRLRFSRAAEFGRARMAEPRASGPAALFALRAVFEAAVLIYGDVYDALKLFAQKARGSRGRDPEEPPLGGGDERPRACCAMPPCLLFKLQRFR